jgi:stearoyl-CoA desaturase (delta-9 desaturase)
MVTMSRAWERIFYVLTFVAQGPSFLDPRAYAIMHRRHHSYSDTERDPHSPRQSGNVVAMMLRTYREYSGLKKTRPADDSGLPAPPEWLWFDRYVGHIAVRILFMGLYVAFYLQFAAAAWQFLLLPGHFLMGPIHGAIVNWCGHRYGYRNYNELDDDSRNTLPFDFLTLGELFQNNHHQAPNRPNFAHRAFEFDPTYPLLRLLNGLRVIEMPSASSGGRGPSMR